MTPVQETENLDSEEQVETVLDLESEEPDVVVEEEVLVNNTRNLSTQEQTVETVETVVQLDTNFKVIYFHQKYSIIFIHSGDPGD